MRAGIPASDDESRITVRVSRDGGRTYDNRAAVVVPHQWADENTDPLASLLANQWPPCRCPLHR